MKQQIIMNKLYETEVMIKNQITYHQNKTVLIG